MTLAAALRALADSEARAARAETRAQQLEWERTRLTLRVQDLEQQLAPRGRGVPAPDATALSLFHDDVAMPESVGPSAVPASGPPRVPKRPMAASASASRRPGRKPLDPSLPREVIRLPDPPETSRVDVFTGQRLTPGFTETLEVLARKPAVYFVKRYERTVWVSPAKTAPVATPWPPSALPRAGIDASVVAHVATAHFVEHVPYYRLEQQLARTGVTLARTTQVSLMAQLDARVAPIVEALKRDVLASGYVHLDATPIDVCDPERPGAARSATVWAYRARSPDPTRDGLVWFDYRATKSPADRARSCARRSIAASCRRTARRASIRSDGRSTSAIWGVGRMHGATSPRPSKRATAAPRGISRGWIGCFASTRGRGVW